MIITNKHIGNKIIDFSRRNILKIWIAIAPTLIFGVSIDDFRWWLLVIPTSILISIKYPQKYKENNDKDNSSNIKE